MASYGVEDVLREQFRLHVRQPEAFAKTVTGDRFDAAVFTVGIGVVDCTVDEVVQARQHAQRARQPVIARAVGRVVHVPVLPDAVPHISFRPVVDWQPVINKTPLGRGAAVLAKRAGFASGAGVAFLCSENLLPENQYPPDEEAQLDNGRNEGDAIQITRHESRDAGQDEQPEDDKYSADVVCFVHHHAPTLAVRGWRNGRN